MLLGNIGTADRWRIGSHSSIVGQGEDADGKSSEFRRNTEDQLIEIQQCWFLSIGKHIAATQDDETGEPGGGLYENHPIISL